jgi:hypothetical protein
VGSAPCDQARLTVIETKPNATVLECVDASCTVHAHVRTTGVSKREAVEAQTNDIAKPKTTSNLGHAALLRRCELPL